MRRPKICTSQVLAALAVAALILPRPAVAHLGPPYPVIVDQPIPGYRVTVLANPDVGQAVAYVVLEPELGAMAPSVATVDVWIQPQDGYTGKRSVRATEETARTSRRYFAQPDFDAVGRWALGVELHLGDGRVFTFQTEVEATPPGVGPWGLVLFSSPIVLFGALFWIVLIRRKRARFRGHVSQCHSQLPVTARASATSHPRRPDSP